MMSRMNKARIALVIMSSFIMSSIIYSDVMSITIEKYKETTDSLDVSENSIVSENLIHNSTSNNSISNNIVDLYDYNIMKASVSENDLEFYSHGSKVSSYKMYLDNEKYKNNSARGVKLIHEYTFNGRVIQRYKDKNNNSCVVFIYRDKDGGLQVSQNRAIKIEESIGTEIDNIDKLNNLKVKINSMLEGKISGTDNFFTENALRKNKNLIGYVTERGYEITDLFETGTGIICFGKNRYRRLIMAFDLNRQQEVENMVIIMR